MFRCTMNDYMQNAIAGRNSTCYRLKGIHEMSIGNWKKKEEACYYLLPPSFRTGLGKTGGLMAKNIHVVDSPGLTA